MDWIKKHYDRFALIILAVILAGSSGYLIWSVKQLPDSFAAAKASPPHQSKLTALENAALVAASQSLVKPAAWAKPKNDSSLLVSRTYVLKDGTLINPMEGDAKLHPPVPNKWFVDNGLPLLDGDVLTQDPSGCGFNNLEKWKEGCNPWDPASHPPYIVKLRLKQYIPQTFHYVFESYDGTSFQVNPIDLHKGTQFLNMGDKIEGTPFKLASFKKIIVPNEATGGETDKSELTIQDTETGENLVLPLHRQVPSLKPVGVFTNLYDNSEIQVKKGQSFSINPEKEAQYKLIDISENNATISDPKKPDGTRSVPKLGMD